jgi:GTP-binding protein
LFESQYVQKRVVLIIDARIGPTKLDLEMIDLLEQHKKNIVVVANKVDKIKSSVYQKQIKSIQEKIGEHTIIPYSAEKKTGTEELWDEIS